MRIGDLPFLVLFFIPLLTSADVWHVKTIDETMESGFGNSLALDGANNPHCSHNDGANGDLKYSYWNGAGWMTEAVDTIGVVGFPSSLALDSLDRPHISYRDYTNADLKYAWFDGSAWQIEVVDSVGDVGYWNCLALDSAGLPHISYYDESNSALKYAYKHGGLSEKTYLWVNGCFAMDSAPCDVHGIQ